MNNKTTAIIYYLASALFFVKAILNFTDSGFSTGVVWMCLGAACLCLASTAKNRKNESDDEEDSDEK